MKYRIGTHKALEKFKNLFGDLKSKLLILNHDLSKVYGIEPPQIIFVRKFKGGSCYFPVGNVMILQDVSDVLVFLHQFAYALGKEDAFTWAFTLFQRHYNVCTRTGHKTLIGR